MGESEGKGLGEKEKGKGRTRKVMMEDEMEEELMSGENSPCEIFLQLSTR